MGSLTVDRDAWDDARRTLGDDGLPFTPYLLDRPERITLAKRLYAQGWTLKMVAAAFGVSWQAIHQWLNGTSADPEKLKSYKRRPRTTPQGGEMAHLPKPGERRRRSVEVSEPVEVQPRPLDEPEPSGPWFDNDDDQGDDDDNLHEPAPRPAPRSASTTRAKSSKEQRFGATWTPMVEAALLARHGLDHLGRPIGAQQATTEPREPATPTAAAPAPIPPPPALRPPVVAPQRPAAAPGTVALELECGHVERNLPVNGPWVQRRWVACTRCNLAHRSIRRVIR